MGNKFESQIFRFQSGVVVDLTENKLTAKADNGSSSIESKNLDNYKYIKYTQPRLSIIGMITRTFFGGLILSFVINLIFVNDEWGAIFFDASTKDIFFEWLSILIFIVTLLLTGFIWAVFSFDLFLETGLYDRFIMKFFADKGYAVTIGNRSGNNINFFALDEDWGKIKKLEGAINEFKKYLDERQIKPHQQTAVMTSTPEPKATPISNQLEDLKKLGDLFQNGILTKEEFEQKKTELLKG